MIAHAANTRLNLRDGGTIYQTARLRQTPGKRVLRQGLLHCAARHANTITD